MKIKQKDQIIVISGKDKGKKGKVLKILTKNNKAIVEKINLKTKHVKPKGDSKQGSIITIEAPINLSNIALI